MVWNTKCQQHIVIGKPFLDSLKTSGVAVHGFWRQADKEIFVFHVSRLHGVADTDMKTITPVDDKHDIIFRKTTRSAMKKPLGVGEVTTGTGEWIIHNERHASETRHRQFILSWIHPTQIKSISGSKNIPGDTDHTGAGRTGADGPMPDCDVTATFSKDNLEKAITDNKGEKKVLYLETNCWGKNVPFVISFDCVVRKPSCGLCNIFRRESSLDAPTDGQGSSEYASNEAEHSNAKQAKLMAVVKEPRGVEDYEFSLTIKSSYCTHVANTVHCSRNVPYTVKKPTDLAKQKGKFTLACLS
eukprot:GHVS01100796.1.p1 GENE.GHVS01100796.1~~GHVS01100796.1.p1  ORF type:complete len:300 (-),score=15.94 GHVS01100796.1:180-1079(-)